MKYGYARVSTNEQDLANQLEQLKNAGAEKIYSEKYTGTKRDRPKLDELLSILSEGDELIVAKLDRLSRSVQQGTELISELQEKDVVVNILNMGRIDRTPNGSLMLNMFLAFAQFERDMIVERTQEGKAIAKQQPGYREGRPRKFGKDQIQHAMDLLKDHSYSQVEKMTGISKSTLIRARKNK